MICDCQYLRIFSTFAAPRKAIDHPRCPGNNVEVDKVGPARLPLHSRRRWGFSLHTTKAVTVQLPTTFPPQHCLLRSPNTLWAMESCDDPVAELLDNYHELNSSVIEELDAEPSPLEFMRYVARNRPFVVRKGAANWTATKTWTSSYLSNFLSDQTVNVAVTPKGWVDSLIVFVYSMRISHGLIPFPLHTLLLSSLLSCTVSNT